MSGVSEFESAGVFLASDPLVGVRFQVWPSSIRDSKATNWSNIDIAGRSEPIKTYRSSTARKITLDLIFVASVDEKDEGTPKDVQKKVEFCQSLIYPVTTTTGFSVSPPVLYLIVGDMIRSRCVATNVDVNTEGPWSYDQKVKSSLFIGPGSNNLQIDEGSTPYPSLPIYSTISMSFEEVNVVAHDSTFVRSGRGGPVASRSSNSRRIEFTEEDF